MYPLQNQITSRILCTAFLLLLVYSCDRKSKSVPFPSDRTEFSSPVTSKLEFSEPQKIEWQVNDSTKFEPAITEKMDLGSFPTKPFYPDGFIPLTAPMEQMSFVYDELQDTTINFKADPSKPIAFKTSILEPPLVVKADLPKIKKNAAVGIFELNEDQGLPGYAITAMMEDSHGMMWIATDMGVCRFNGEYLEIYNVIDQIFTGAQSRVNDILEDERGRIWFYTAGKGIYVLDLKAGVISNEDFSKHAFGFNRNCSMIMDNRGLIWLGTDREGIFIIDPNQESFSHIPQLKSGDGGNTKNLVVDDNDNIWVGSATGLSVINYDTGNIRTLKNQRGHSFAPVSGLFMDSQNRIWVGTEKDGVFILNLGQKSMKRLGSAQGIENSIHHFTQGKDNKIWMSSNSGVYIFDPSNQRIKYLNAAKGLSDDLINTTYLDRQGQMWIATSTALNLMDTEGIMPNFLTAADGLSGPDVWYFFSDKEANLWIGSRQGLDIYYPDEHRIRKVEFGLLFKKTVQSAYRVNQMPSGDYLIVSPSIGLAVFNPEQETISKITKAQGLNNTYPASIIVDRKGRIWSGAFQNGMVEYIDLKNNTFKRFSNKNGLIGDFVWEIIEDDKGQIWVATDKGINVINVADNTISQLMEDGKICGRNAGVFLIDSLQRMWIGTRTGLLIADQEKGTVTTITTDNGLIDPSIYTLYENKGKIYVGTGDGFMVFTPNSTKTGNDNFQYDISAYGKGQGLIYTDCNAESAIVYEDKLWMGIETQVLTVMDNPTIDTTQSAAYISGITISDRLQNFQDYNTIVRDYPSLDTLYSAEKDTFFLSGKMSAETGWLKENKITWDSLSGYYNLPVNLKIPYEQNYLSFQFTGSQLTNRDKTRYSYFLEGHDTKWSDISDKPYSENYRNLTAGDYTFKVRSRTFDGLWSEPAELRFTILQHWTNTWWAWLLYILAFMIVVGTIVKFRSRMLKRENALLEEKVKQRTAELNQSIEDLKSTQSQLIQSEKMASLGELTAGIAHEIQNPLNFVNNFSELNRELIAEMRQEISKGNYDEVKEIANDLEGNEEKINAHGKRADSIVKGMLQHSRANTGTKEPTDINALADEYLRLAYHGLRAKDKSFNADIQTNFDESIAKVDLISQDIGRVLLNLFNNAFYAVNERRAAPALKGDIAGKTNFEPTVSLSTKKLGGSIEIRVTDNGNGIPKEILDKIFQPFFTTKPTGQGTGLGLSLSYDIIKAHGGELKVETKENEGTAFTIILPIKHIQT